jgi:hypothetical protein
LSSRKAKLSKRGVEDTDSLLRSRGEGTGTGTTNLTKKRVNIDDHEDHEFDFMGGVDESEAIFTPRTKVGQTKKKNMLAIGSKKTIITFADQENYEKFTPTPDQKGKQFNIWNDADFNDDVDESYLGEENDTPEDSPR